MKLNDELYLCVGAQVVLTRNIDILSGLVNGARGIIVELTSTYVYVNFVNAGLIKIEYYAINSMNTLMQLSEPDIDLAYIPLKLAWALSIHSSQGMTVDALELELGSSIFAYGQAYTGLSRAKNMKSIKLVGLLPESFKTSPDVIEFYSTLV
jgi:ATP-dependent DNA helicase PIF1